MNQNKPILIFILIFQLGCSLYIKSRESISEIKTLPSPPKITSCLNNESTLPSEQIVGPSNADNKLFSTFLKKIEPLGIGALEKGLLWALLQINLRPDLSSPTGRLTLIVKEHKNIKLYDFYTPGEHPAIKTQKPDDMDDILWKEIKQRPRGLAYPYLQGISDILKKYDSPYSLFKLCEIIDKYFPPQIPINKSLERFLEKNRSRLKGHKAFAEVYFKAEQSLKEEETIPRINFSYLNKMFEKEKRKTGEMIASNYQYTSKNGSEFICNQDLNLYHSNKLNIKNESWAFNQFGYIDQSGNGLYGISTQNLDEITPLGDTFLIRGLGQWGHYTFCQTLPSKPNGDVLFFLSHKHRDPGQILYRVLENLSQTTNDNQNLALILKQKRQLKLQNPPRMLLEENQDTTNQDYHMIENQGLPLDYAKAIGDVMAIFNSTLFLDERSSATLSCN